MGKMNVKHLSKVFPNLEISKMGWILDRSGVFCRQGVSRIETEVDNYPEQMFRDDFSSSFWVLSRNSAILEVLRELQIEALLEVGAGNGMVAIPVAKEGIAVVAVEPSYLGCQVLASEQVPVFNGTLDQLLLPSNTLNAVGLFDVLEHVPDTSSLLAEIYRVLTPGGYLLLTVPSYNWLFGEFDINVGHYRRYTRKKLSKTVGAHGFIDVSSRYLFSLLVIPALFMRRIPYLIWKSRKEFTFGQIEEAMNPGKILNALLTRYFTAERKMMLPFGTSLLMVCKKPDVLESPKRQR